MPTVALTESTGAASVVRRRIQRMTPAGVSDVAHTLANEVNNDAIATLGYAAEDPSCDEILSVLDDLIAAHGAPLVALLLAAYADGDFPARAACRQVLEEDPRVALDVLGPKAEPREQNTRPQPPPRTPADDVTQARRRERRDREREDRRQRAVEMKLDELPEKYDAELFQQKCEVVYLHVFDSYWDDGRSIYSTSRLAG